MKIFTLFLFLSLFTSIHLTAQTRERYFINQDTSQQPLILVDSLQTDINYLFLDANKVQAIDVFKDAAAIKQFGERGKNGVVVIKTKANVSLLRLPELLEKYNLPDSVKKLRVCINEILVKRPELLLIDETKIRGVGTMALIDWNYVNKPTDETVINISVEKSEL